MVSCCRLRPVFLLLIAEPPRYAGAASKRAATLGVAVVLVTVALGIIKIQQVLGAIRGG